MKNKILKAISIIMAVVCALGICLLDSTGIAFVVAVLMVAIPSVCWFLPLIIANRGRL